MVNEHTTPIFVKNSYERPFSKMSKANTNEFSTRIGLHQKSNNVTYGKETYVGRGVRASMNDHFQ
jgi:hypothetical protein